MHIPEELKERARKSPGQWVYELDWEFAADEFVPPEAVKLAVRMVKDTDGEFEFAENETYRPIIHAARSPRKHMLHTITPSMLGKWISETDPAYDDQFPDIPVEGIVGSWYLDEGGVYSGLFRANPSYKGTMTP